jgi:hypothetical protein
VRIVVDPTVRSEHAAIRQLVSAGFDGVDGSEVEVRVRPAGRPSRSFTGRAYASVPRSATVGPGVHYLVILFVPSVLRNRGYPKTHRYPRLRTAPWITTYDWREGLVALAAHEACHVRQFQHDLRRSEVEAERWAKSVLEAWMGPPEAGRGTDVADARPAAEAAAGQLVLELFV